MSTETGRDLRWASAETSAYCWNRCQQLLQNEKTRDSCKWRSETARREAARNTAFFVFFYPEREELFPECFSSLSPLLSTQVSLNLKLWLARCFCRESFFSCFFFVCLQHLSYQLDIQTDSTTIQDNSPAATDSSDSIIRTQLDSVPLSFIPLQDMILRRWWRQVKWKTAQNTYTEWSHVISWSYLHRTLSSSLWTHWRKGRKKG